MNRLSAFNPLELVIFEKALTAYIADNADAFDEQTEETLANPSHFDIVASHLLNEVELQLKQQTAVTESPVGE